MSWGRHLRLAAALALSLCAVTPARAETAPAAPSTEQLQQLVATLKDDKARAQLEDELQALIAAQSAESNEAAAPAASWFADLPAEFDAIGGEVLAAAPILAQAPRLYAWAETQVSDPDLRQRWLEIIVKLVVIFGAGFAADALARFLLRRPAKLLAARSTATPATRAGLLALAAGVEILPVLIFAGVAAFVIPLTEPNLPTRQAASLLIAATVWARGLVALARIGLLSPAAQSLYPLGEETRNYLYIWMRRFAYWAAYGYAVSVVAWWLGAPGAIDGLLLRFTVLVMAILAILFVLQNRRAVADWLRGQERARGEGRVPHLRLAEHWYVIAIVYIVGTFGVYVLNAQGGIDLLLRATALSLVVVTAAALLKRFVDSALYRGFAVNPELKTRFPDIEARANRYLPIVTVASEAVIYAIAVLALLQAWGIERVRVDSARSSPQRATGSIVSLAVVIVIGVVLWEISQLDDRAPPRPHRSHRTLARPHPAAAAAHHRSGGVHCHRRADGAVRARARHRAALGRRGHRGHRDRLRRPGPRQGRHHRILRPLAGYLRGRRPRRCRQGQCRLRRGGVDPQFPAARRRRNRSYHSVRRGLDRAQHEPRFRLCRV